MTKAMKHIYKWKNAWGLSIEVKSRRKESKKRDKSNPMLLYHWWKGKLEQVFLRLPGTTGFADLSQSCVHGKKMER